jgi:hypothetical protein
VVTSATLQPWCASMATEKECCCKLTVDPHSEPVVESGGSTVFGYSVVVHMLVLPALC